MEEEVRREIQEGLNVVESWNSANSFILYGKRGEISTKEVDAQEVAVLSIISGCPWRGFNQRLSKRQHNLEWLNRQALARQRLQRAERPRFVHAACCGR